MSHRMLVHANGHERTLGNFIQLASETGWKITQIYAPSAAMAHIVTEPV